MRARNKHTGQECEVFWMMCDCGRKCSASDQPNASDEMGYNYNAIVDDYEFWVNNQWIDGLEYIKHPYSYWLPKKPTPDVVTDDKLVEITRDVIKNIGKREPMTVGKCFLKRLDEMRKLCTKRNYKPVRFSITAMRYPRPYWFILPTIEFSDLREDSWNTALWTIDLRWLRIMITIAKLRNDKTGK